MTPPPYSLKNFYATRQFHWHEIRRRRKSESAKVRDYEKQIDQLVYLSAKALASADKLYGLTPEEIKIVNFLK